MNNFRSWTSLFLLNLAATALTLAGYTYRQEIELNKIILLIFGTTSLTSFVYFFNDILDNFEQHSWFKLFINSRFGVSLISFIVYLFFHFQNFNMVSSIALFSILLVGLSYSLKIPLGASAIRFKNYYYLKNVFIAVGWCLLLIYGHGYVAKSEFFLLVAFVFLQVFIGSSIRDISDVEKDKDEGVQTLPVQLGIDATLSKLHMINLLSAMVVMLDGYDSELTWMLPVAMWRFFNLKGVRLFPKAQLNLQVINLLTCVLIFIGRIVS